MRHVALLLMLAGCAASPPAAPPGSPTAAPEATVLRFPSELPVDAALGLSRNTLRRAGWPAEPPLRGTLTTEWRETPEGPLRLVVTAKDTDGGASTVVAVRGETRDRGRAVGVARGAAAWPRVERAARHVGAEVRYARP